MFYIVILFEHILLALKVIISWVIKEVPEYVEKELQYKAVMKDKVLYPESKGNKGLRKIRKKKMIENAEEEGVNINKKLLELIDFDEINNDSQIISDRKQNEEEKDSNDNLLKSNLDKNTNPPKTELPSELGAVVNDINAKT